MTVTSGESQVDSNVELAALRRRVSELEQALHARSAELDEERRQRASQEEVIQSQKAALYELSAPLIPLSEQIMVMPLVGTLDGERAERVLEALVAGVSGSRASIAILDVTGVPVLDVPVAAALGRAAQAVKLLGAQIVLSGLRAELSRSMEGPGRELSNIVTYSTLRAAVAYAMGVAR